MKWWEKYEIEDDKIDVLKQFLGVAVRSIHDDTTNRKSLLRALKEADSVARKIAGHKVAIQDGWKLHKTWFRSGFAQLAILGSLGSRQEEYEHYRKELQQLYNELGWDFTKCYSPKYTRVLSTMTLPFFRGLMDNGEDLYGDFKTLIEPLAKYPDGSVYESRHSGKQWEVCYQVSEDVYWMVAEEKNKFGSYREMEMDGTTLGKMIRVV